MYSTCLFCNGKLGSNEALEHFQIGRRLAYDPAKGRLWVVCARCERWNLSPLETRWEAIEDAERSFRASRLRVSTDNVGLAKLREGLELVRIGAPPRLELAGWRYGDQFGRRRRRTYMIGAATMVIPAVMLAGTIAGASIAALSLANSAGQIAASFRRKLKRTKVRVGDRELHLSDMDMRNAALTPDRKSQDWYLHLPYSESLSAPPGTPLAKKLPRINSPFRFEKLNGDDAMRVLAAILPHVNSDGGTERKVRRAVDLISESDTATAFLRRAAEAKNDGDPMRLPTGIRKLPAPLRLALEMVLHENDERRALEGELAELETRWREAEEIASIADSLLLPATVDERLAEMQRVLRSSGTRPGSTAE